MVFITFISRKFAPLVLFLFFFLVLPAGIALAGHVANQPSHEGNQGSVRLTNPLKGDIDTIPEFVEAILNIVLTIGVPIVVLAFIFSGFLFVSAQGNTEKLSQAKQAFLYTFIGAVVLLGAYVLAEAIGGTVQQLTT